MENIAEIIVSFQQKLLQTEGITRNFFQELLSNSLSKPIKVITGFRRSGKSTLVTLLGKKLVEENKYLLSNVLYLNFENIKLNDYSSLSGLQDIYKSFITIVAKQGSKLLILDEIQLVPDWEKFVRSIYESEKDINIIITGSNSDLLSGELSSKLAGRTIEYMLMPFNFKEYLLFQNIEITTKKDLWEARDKIEIEFNKYLVEGGLPETLLIPTFTAKKSYLDGIMKKVILDDIVKRFQVRNIDLLEELLKYTFSTIGNLFSPTRVAERIKAIKSIPLNPNLIIEFMGYFQKTFSVFELNKLDWKQSKVFDSKRKYYGIDTGLIEILSSERGTMTSKRLENIVFLHLRSEEKPLYFASDDLGKEIDFVIEREKSIFDKYQVTETLTHDNIERELGNLLLAGTYLQKGKKYIVCQGPTKQLEYKGQKIEQVNIVEFLLDLV